MEKEKNILNIEELEKRGFNRWTKGIKIDFILTLEGLNTLTLTTTRAVT